VQKKYIKQTIIAGLVMFSIAIMTSVVVNAIVSEEDPTPITTNQDDERQVIRPESPNIPPERIKERLISQEEKRAEIKTKLLDARLKACQQREKAIGNIMLRMSNRGTKQLAVFTKISDRVQAFYTEKGLTLDNYDVLVAEVNAKKIEAEAFVATVKESAPTFKCDGTDPRGAANSFKENLKAQNTSLKSYRTAIKNLIVAIRSMYEKTAEDQGGQ